jgi:hypothetical protein
LHSEPNLTERLYEEEKRRTNALLFRFFSKLLDVRYYPKAQIRQGADRIGAPARRLVRRAGTCHNADSPRTVAMTILPTQGLAAGSVSPMSHHKRRIALLVIATQVVPGPHRRCRTAGA